VDPGRAGRSLNVLIVPDASVILKWVLPCEEEPDWDRARRLLEGFVEGETDMIVPSLWFFEAGNTLARRFGFDVADSMLHWLLELGIPERGPRSWATTAVALAANRGVTFYDAAYYAVAVERGGVLVTADRRFVKTLGDDPAVVSLGSSEED